MKPTLLKSPSFVVEDHRTGKDFQDINFSLLKQVFVDNAGLWEELIETMIAEWGITPVTVKLLGMRKSFLAKANRGKNMIKMTTHSISLDIIEDNADKMSLLIATFIHELGHLVTPVTEKFWSKQRDIHGPKFKKNVYLIAQWANAIGLLPDKLVMYSLGNATTGRVMEVLGTIPEPYKVPVGSSNTIDHTNTVRIGDTIQWNHSGHKWGGLWIGVVHNKTSKNLKVSNCTKDGKENAGQWTIPIMSSNYTIISSITRMSNA